MYLHICQCIMSFPVIFAAGKDWTREQQEITRRSILKLTPKYSPTQLDFTCYDEISIDLTVNILTDHFLGSMEQLDHLNVLWFRTLGANGKMLQISEASLSLMIKRSSRCHLCLKDLTGRSMSTQISLSGLVNMIQVGILCALWLTLGECSSTISFVQSGLRPMGKFIPNQTFFISTS